MGISRPITCAVYGNKFTSLSIYPNVVIAMNKKQQARINEQRIGNKYRLGGHGKKNKFAGTEGLSVDYRQRRKKVMEDWSSQVVDFFVNENIGTVYLEKTSNKNALLAKYKYPVTELIDRIERGLKQKGIQIKKHKTYYVSQICSECGHYNKGFSFPHRLKNGFPKFKCADGCLTIIPAERNAASNVANPKFENILEKFALLK